MEEVGRREKRLDRGREGEGWRLGKQGGERQREGSLRGGSTGEKGERRLMWRKGGVSKGERGMEDGEEGGERQRERG